MVDMLVKNGTIVTEKQSFAGNVAIEQGKIAGVLSAADEPSAKEVVDASGLLVCPGFIDTHAHLNEPGYEWREDYAHGTKAAAAGGYTTVIDMPLQNTPALIKPELFDRKERTVRSRACADYCFLGGIIPGNIDQIAALAGKGVVGFKVFLGPVSPDFSTLSYGQAYEAMLAAGNSGSRICFHCEDYSIIRCREEALKKEAANNWKAFLNSRPESAEVIASKAVIEMAEETGCPAHICHISSPQAAEMVHQAQKNHFDITAETCAHYLTFSEDDLLANGELYKCAPPLRPQVEREMLWKYVANGTFSGIASDHSPCSREEKYDAVQGRQIRNVFDVWGGISGIQSCIQSAFYEGCVKRNLGVSAFVSAASTRPARAFGLYGRKGDIQPGFDADLVLIDPERAWKITADSLYYVNRISAYVGRAGRGMPVCTILRGMVVARNGKFTGREGCGKLIRK